MSKEMLSDLGKAISQFVYSALLTLSIGLYVCMGTFTLAISPPFAVVGKFGLWEIIDKKPFGPFVLILIMLIIFGYMGFLSFLGISVVEVWRFFS